MAFKLNPITGKLDLIEKDHLALDNIGTNTHAQIDTHIAANPVGTAQGQMQFWDAGGGKWEHTEISELFWDDTNKRLGVGVDTPLARLHLDGGGLLITGGLGDTPVSGAGNRMMWIPAKGAFRAGGVAGTQWDAANIGDYSLVFGNEGKASGASAASFGYSGEAPGDYSTHFGYDGIASGDYSTHFGAVGTASGVASVHFGYLGIASGLCSTHFGFNGRALGDYSWVGGGNMQLTAAADRTFVFGYNASATAIIVPDCFLVFPVVNSGRFAIGTVSPVVSAAMEIASTTGAFLLSRMTTAQKNALTAVNGMMLYDATLNQTQTYENGAWRQI